MHKTIINPKVFISYSWGSNEHQEKVLSFATRLMNDGIDVILDKWDLTEGNDMNAFMEKCVNDSSVTNVLMLLDKNYAEKADKKEGGVGTETQIISAKVYKEVNQDKFIPIVFERDSNGNIFKPIYLQSRYHFDLSQSESFEDNYKRLVRKLFGINTYKKPEVGNKPDWVDNQIVASPQTIVEYDALKADVPYAVKKEQFKSYLNTIRSEIVLLLEKLTTESSKVYISLYDLTKPIRSNYLLLLSKTAFIQNAVEYIAQFFEDSYNTIIMNASNKREIGLVFLHELFIYTISHYYRFEDYHSIGYILGKTYFNQSSYSESKQIASFHLIYSGMYHTNLDSAIRERDGKNYCSGTANHWLTTIDAQFCTKEEFIAADLICYNYSVYGNDYLDSWKWFPITYIYENQFSSSIRLMAKKLISREYLEKLIVLFNYGSIDGFKSKFMEVEEAIHKGELKEYRYPMSFEDAPILGHYIKASQLGTVR